MCDLSGKYATLNVPDKGYKNIQVLERSGNKWLVEICGSGKEIEVYEDEFELDDERS